MSKFISMKDTPHEHGDRQRVVNRAFKTGVPFSVYAYSVTDRSRYEYGNPHHVGWRKEADRPKAKPHAQARIRVRVIPKREVLEYHKWPTVKIGNRYHLVNHELRYLTPGLFSAGTLTRSRKLMGQDNNYRDLLRTNYIREFGQ